MLNVEHYLIKVIFFISSMMSTSTVYFDVIFSTFVRWFFLDFVSPWNQSKQKEEKLVICNFNEMQVMNLEYLLLFPCAQRDYQH